MESSVASAAFSPARSPSVRLVRGDITLQDVDAFVFYAQPDLALGAGFGGAISVRGGPSVQKELTEVAKNGPVATGDVVVTGAGKLRAKHILHAVGPRFREADIEAKLFRTVVRCLEVAREKGVRSLALPAMGAGYYGIPPAVSARVTLEAMHAFTEQGSGLDDVVICVFDTPQHDAFQAALAARG